ncbi:MAG: HNH endonuclease [Cyclobacteriaceae bacterium]|nr:HNH endonuclease [Cyclobacteriaceae bacterium]
MTRKALVLNLDYTPISVCSAQRAFLLVYLNKAELIKSNSGLAFHTIDKSYDMPAVIKINRYVNVPFKGVVLSRENVFKRDGFTCQYCGTNQDLTLDHLIPKAKGGETKWNNLVTACKKCNSRKGDFNLEEIGMQLAFRPYRPSYIMYLKDLSGANYNEWKPYLRKKSPRVA